MKRRRILSLLLALILALGAAPAALCADAQTSVVCGGGEDGVFSLSLENLDGKPIYGIQLELVLNGTYDCTFTASSITAYSPKCRVDIADGKTIVTLYLTDREAMNQGTDLELGKLDLGTGAWTDALPDSAKVILLDENLRPTNTAIAVDAPQQPPVGPDDPTEPTDSTEPTEPTAPAYPVYPVYPGGNNTSKPADTSKPGDDKKDDDSQKDEEEEPAAPAQPANPTVPAMSFSDVAAADWFYDAVRYVYAHSIMNGTDTNAFSPNQTTTRGMIVTMLHRLENSPSAQPAAFQDVASGAYYAGPVAWASANNIVNGTGDGRFSPENSITREQLATILFRFAQYKGLNTAVNGDLSAFSDASAVSSYATSAMRWAVGSGLITGSDGKLDPAGNATRAQVAAIFQRMCANLMGIA